MKEKPNIAVPVPPEYSELDGVTPVEVTVKANGSGPSGELSAGQVECVQQILDVMNLTWDHVWIVGKKKGVIVIHPSGTGACVHVEPKDMILRLHTAPEFGVLWSVDPLAGKVVRTSEKLPSKKAIKDYMIKSIVEFEQAVAETNRMRDKVGAAIKELVQQVQTVRKWMGLPELQTGGSLEMNDSVLFAMGLGREKKGIYPVCSADDSLMSGVANLCQGNSVHATIYGAQKTPSFEGNTVKLSGDTSALTVDCFGKQFGYRINVSTEDPEFAEAIIEEAIAQMARRHPNRFVRYKKVGEPEAVKQL